jgi:hypothetical protein
MDLTSIQTQLISLTLLAIGEYADARQLLRSGSEEASDHFVLASEHALHAGMLAGERDLVQPEDIEGHVALRGEFQKGVKLGYELAHPATLRDA